MNLTFINYYAPILIFIVSTVLIWAGLAKLKIIPNNIVNLILSVILSIILITSQDSVNFLFGVLPYLTLILTVSFVMLLILVFIAKDIGIFKTPLAWIGFALAIVIILSMMFGTFPTMNHMLPNSSDSGLNSSMHEFKDFIYSQNFKDNFIFVLSLVVVGFLLFKAN